MKQFLANLQQFTAIIEQFIRNFCYAYGEMLCRFILQIMGWFYILRYEGYVTSIAANEQEDVSFSFLLFLSKFYTFRIIKLSYMPMHLYCVSSFRSLGMLHLDLIFTL